ncbi:MAG: ATPase [Candidatus Micrarchaeia archaeon]|jgi:V/A-type H+-transporting ATPase subunit K
MVELGTGLIAVGAGLAILGGALGTAYAQAAIGAAGMGMLTEKEGKEGTVLLFVAIPETMIIISFVVAFLLIGKLE